ncbi:MAG: YdeI/OmpD-associated family protein [Candidatus Pacebacteria bacterium]|nr:YdeI/OmpD-associated family protein [Candidatus Paceibacterota bacterium]
MKNVEKVKVVLTFQTPQEFSIWLAKNHAKSSGVWARIFKKASDKKGITYAEALDEALCYGWIDSLKKKYDADSYIQKFSPRKPKSVWSKINTDHVVRLTKAKRMKPAGLAVVLAAKTDGRWADAYESSATMEIPSDFLAELKKDKKAQAFFDTLNRANIYAIGWRLQTAKKPETRAKRMDAILAMLKLGKKFH